MFRIGLFGAALLFLGACSPKGGSETYVVEEGPFVATITETGELQARQTRQINCPNFNYRYGAAKLMDIVPQGTAVHKGAYVAQMDTSVIARKLAGFQADLNIAKRDYEQLLIKQQQEMELLRSKVVSNRAALALAAMDTASVQFDPPSSIKRSRLQFKINLIGQRQLEAKLAATDSVQRIDRFMALKKITTLKRQIKKARRTIRTYTLFAPSDGIVQYANRGRRRGTVKIGDDFWPGETIAELPDLERMKVLTTIHETDIDKVQIGQPVEVALDAYPSEKFKGTITYISRTCRQKGSEETIKVFDLLVLLKDKSPILKPGMTVSCTITTARMKKTLFIPLQFATRLDGKAIVYRQTANGPQPVRIVIGARNTKYLAVSSGLSAGNRLLHPSKVSTTHAF